MSLRLKQRLDLANFGDPLSFRSMPAIPAIAAKTKREQISSKVVEGPKTAESSAFPIKQLEKVDILVAGSLAVDLSCDYAPLSEDRTNVTPTLHTSNPAVIGQSLGGVGYNVAIATSYLGSSVLFCSVVGDDLSGRAALSTLQKESLSTEGVQVLPASSGTRTAQYIAMNDAKKNLLVAMADMGIMELPEKDLDFDGFWEPMIRRTKPRWVVVDANWSPGVLAKWVNIAKKYGARIAFEPVSTPKSRRLFSKGPETDAAAAIGPSDSVPNNSISLAAPNQLELAVMYTTAREAGLFDSSGWWRAIDAMGMSSSGSRERLVAMTSAALVDEGIPQQNIQLLPFIPCIITKLGAQGVLLTQLLRPGDPRLSSPEHIPYILSRASMTDDLVGGVYMRLFPPAETLGDEDVVSVNGAGDTLLGAVVAGLARGAEDTPRQVEDFIPVAQEASVRTLKSAGGVSRDIVGLRGVLEGLC